MTNSAKHRLIPERSLLPLGLQEASRLSLPLFCDDNTHDEVRATVVPRVAYSPKYRSCITSNTYWVTFTAASTACLQTTAIMSCYFWCFKQEGLWICPNTQKIFENLFMAELSTQSDIQEWLKWKFLHKCLVNMSWLIEMAFWVFSN